MKSLLNQTNQTLKEQRRSIMHTEEIREKLAMQVSYRPEWLAILSGTNPRYYGFFEYDILVDITHIKVNIPEGTFQITDVHLNCTLIQGVSSDDDCISTRFDKLARGSGRFRFDEYLEKTIIEELILNVDIDLFE